MQTDNNATPKYRRDGNHLFKFDKQQRAYVHCYQDPFCNSLQSLIKAYENDLPDDRDSDE